MDSTKLFERRVEKVLPNQEGLIKLIEEKGKIRLYQGFDPTFNQLHLGHTVGFRKLMDFAKSGHEVIFLFGTGTVLVGDPSLRDTARKLITQDEIDENIKEWQNQVSPIVDFDLVKIKQNGDWLTQLTLTDIIGIASNISAVQLFKRDSFQRRLDQGDTVWYHETMYPLLQGYDSVAMDVDLEIGGTDQEFNMLVGRELQRKMNNREKFVLTTPMINGTDGKPMSKTARNCVWLTDSANDMYGKLMSITDEQIVPYFELLTDVPLDKIKSLPQDPLANKKQLALDITSQFHGHPNAKQAQSHFENTIQAGLAPDDIQTLSISPGEAMSIFEICKLAGVGESSGQIKRTIAQGGVEFAGDKITDPQQIVQPKSGDVLKFGKRTFRRIDIK